MNELFECEYIGGLGKNENIMNKLTK